jgi:hypothetical protein
MASNSKKLGELFGGTEDIKTDVLDNVDPSFVSDKNNTSTGYFDLPNGTTAQRPTAASGMIRFNSTLNLAEYYDGNTWKSIDSPPSVNSASPSYFDAEGDTITVSGDNFQTGISVKLIGADATEYAAASVTRNSATELTFDITAAMIAADDNDPFDIQVTNLNGLAGTLADGVEIASNPTFTTSTGTYVVYDASRATYSFDASATTVDADDTLSYAVTAGSLPTGASLNSSTGAITGFSAVGSDTSSTFTVTATATSAETSDTYTATRQWTITVAAPVITSYTSTGSGTFSVPSGVDAVNVLVVAGGGAGGVDNGGGGGAGGLIYRPAFPVTPGGSVSYTVGAGGAGYSGPISSYPGPSQGNDSIFGTLTAKGGGRAGSWGANGNPIGTRGTAGGSGGGGARYSQYPGYPSVYDGQGGGGTQPQQPGDSGTYGFGNNGGDVNVPAGDGGAGAGGGGSGAAGQTATPSGCGNGGQGKAYSISGSSVTYAGGGGGGSQSKSASSPQPGGGGWQSGTNGQPGTANRGGGGGAGSGGGSETSGSGGSGIVIVSY